MSETMTDPRMPKTIMRWRDEAQGDAPAYERLPPSERDLREGYNHSNTVIQRSWFVEEPFIPRATYR